MKKLLLCLLALLVITGCSTKENTVTETENAETDTVTDVENTESGMLGGETIANPIVSVDSLDEINETLLCAMTSPAVMGSEDVSYSIISGNLGQYVFTVNGLEYTYRFEADTTDDISGIYGSDGTIFKTTDDTYYEDETYKAYRWFNIDGQYCIAVEDNGTMEKDTFIGICEEFETYSNDNMVNKNGD